MVHNDPKCEMSFNSCTNKSSQEIQSLLELGMIGTFKPKSMYSDFYHSTAFCITTHLLSFLSLPLATV